jgi:hypothetical protein
MRSKLSFGRMEQLLGPSEPFWGSLANQGPRTFAYWVTQNSGVATDLLSVAYGRGIFVAKGDLGSEFLSSTNGIDWVRRALPAIVYPHPRAAFVNDTFMFVGGRGMILQAPSETIALAGKSLGDEYQIIVRGGRPGAVLQLQKCTEMSSDTWRTSVIFTNALPLLRLRERNDSRNAFYRVASQVP